MRTGPAAGAGGPAAPVAATTGHGRAAAPTGPDRAFGSAQARSARAWPRLARLHAVSRRLVAVLAVIVGCGIGLRVALIWHWDAYGALQLPLVFETAAAAAIASATASPFGEPERVAGRWLPGLRLASVLALTAFAVAVFAAAGAGGHLAGGTLDVGRNLAGITGLGLLCATVLGGGLAWAGPVAYLVAGTYALYTQWHPPALTSPWIWAARPPHDLGGAGCAGLVFACGIGLITIRGARDPS
jgi:hypothetical protein